MLFLVYKFPLLKYNINSIKFVRQEICAEGFMSYAQKLFLIDFC